MLSPRIKDTFFFEGLQRSITYVFCRSIRLKAHLPVYGDTPRSHLQVSQWTGVDALGLRSGGGEEGEEEKKKEK